MKNRASGLLAEGILIVISILVAFAIDAWWAERQDREEEKRILHALRAEFLTNLKVLPAFVSHHAMCADSAGKLIDSLRNEVPGDTVLVNDAVLNSVLQHNSFDPKRGALDSVLQSGEMRLIRNNEIRERLSGWPALVADAIENEVLLRTEWGPRLNVFLMREVDLAPLDDLWECFDAETQQTCSRGEVAITASTDLIGLLVNIRGWAGEAANELTTVQREAQAIIAMIDGELTTDP